jgi:hypothetical protein
MAWWWRISFASELKLPFWRIGAPALLTPRMPSSFPAPLGGWPACGSQVMIWAPASSRADWTTYRVDACRSSVDSGGVGSLPFAAAWSSPGVGGGNSAEPLVHDGLVIVATERDEVVAVNEATGQGWAGERRQPGPVQRPELRRHQPMGWASPRRR